MEGGFARVCDEKEGENVMVRKGKEKPKGNNSRLSVRAHRREGGGWKLVRGRWEDRQTAARDANSKKKSGLDSMNGQSGSWRFQAQTCSVKKRVPQQSNKKKKEQTSKRRRGRKQKNSHLGVGKGPFPGGFEESVRSNQPTMLGANVTRASHREGESSVT